MVSEVSRGFREDCFAFLAEFTKHESLEFRYFCHEWKKMNFQLVFHGRNTDVEMVEFGNEALLIIKHIFLSFKRPTEKAGAFFLMYALYFKQPTNLFCKIRVTPSDWGELKRFVRNPAPGRESQEIAVIFWKLFIGDAFRFVQDEKEYGYDTFFIKGLQSNRYDDKVRESFKIIKEADKDFRAMKSITGLFTALDALEMGYNEMKESLEETETACSLADKIPQSNLMQSLHEDLDIVISILNTDEPAVGSSGGPALQFETNEEDQQDELAVHSSESIGAKRSSLRERAFKRKIHKKDLQIATSSTPVSTSCGGHMGMRPRATKKRDLNTSILNNESHMDTSTGEDEPAI